MKTLDDLILDAVTPVVKPCVQDLYTGEAVEYCTFNYNELAAAFGDNRAHAMRALVQVHYLAPLKANTVATRRALWQALATVNAFLKSRLTAWMTCCFRSASLPRSPMRWWTICSMRRPTSPLPRSRKKPKRCWSAIM